MRIFFFFSFYSYKWNNNRSSYSLRYLKARMLWECRYQAKSHTASHAAFISVAVLSISPQHSARGLHDFFPFPGCDFDTVTHYCCQIINTSETVPEKEKKKKLNPMQALHVGSSVLQWLSCKEKAHSHLDAPTGISCLATLALLDTLQHCLSTSHRSYPWFKALLGEPPRFPSFSLSEPRALYPSWPAAPPQAGLSPSPKVQV